MRNFPIQDNKHLFILLKKSNFCKFTEQVMYSEKKTKEQLFPPSWERMGSWLRMNPAEKWNLKGESRTNPRVKIRDILEGIGGLCELSVYDKPLHSLKLKTLHRINDLISSCTTYWLWGLEPQFHHMIHVPTHNLRELRWKLNMIKQIPALAESFWNTVNAQ